MIDDQTCQAFRYLDTSVTTRSVHEEKLPDNTRRQSPPMHDPLSFFLCWASTQDFPVLLFFFFTPSILEERELIPVSLPSVYNRCTY